MSSQQPTQDPSLWENSVVEGLSKKIQAISDDLDNFQTDLESLSLEERNSKLEGIESAILECSNDLADLEVDGNIFIDKKDLESLRSKIESLRLSKEDLKGQIESQSRSEMKSLSQSVVDSEDSPAVLTDKTWLGRQREGLTSKQEWKENTGANALRALGGIGLVGGTVWLFNRIFGGKKKKETSTSSVESGKSKRELRREKRAQRRKERAERRENRPWWQKFLIGGAVAGGTVVGGVQVYKHWNQITSWVKEKLGLALSFDEAKQKVEDEVRNGKIDDDHFGVFNSNFENGITFNEETQEICSYDQKTKIDKKNKKLEGLDVSFASYEELIHAANIVNFAKRKLRGRGATARPFGQTERGGDIAFNCSVNGKQEFLSANNSNEWSWILGTVGVAGGGILGGYCAGVKGAAIGGLAGGAGGYALGAYIDNTSAAGRCCSTIARGKNFDLFILYLNDQKDENGKSLWESAGEQVLDPNDTPINSIVHNGETDRSKMGGVLAEIEKTYGEDQTGRRNLNIKWDESNPTEYIIESYGHSTKLTIEGGPTKKGENIDYSKIKKIHVEKYNEKDRGDGLDIDFPKTEDGLKEAIRVINLTNMIREDWSGKGGGEFPFMYGMYIQGITNWSFNLDIDTPGIGSNYQGGTCVLSHDALKNKYPTIFKDMDKTRALFIKGIPSEKDRHDQASDDKSEGSQYIKFLHQMRSKNGGNYWKKI